MQRRRLLEEFNKFCQACVSERVSPSQKRDLRIAFMSGAAALHFTMVAGLVSKSFITPADVQMVRDVQEELEVYVTDLREGRA